jgi:hypothetical protein
MRLTGHRQSERFGERYKRLSKDRKERTEATMRKVALAFLQAASPADLPQPLNRPSNTKPFRRAQIDGDLRLYWWVDGETLVFHDICDHRQASGYSDTHK